MLSASIPHPQPILGDSCGPLPLALTEPSCLAGDISILYRGTLACRGRRQEDLGQDFPCQLPGVTSLYMKRK